MVQVARFGDGAEGEWQERGSILSGAWLSLVEHSLGVRGVGSSNLPVPAIDFSDKTDAWMGASVGDCRPRAPQPVSAAHAKETRVRPARGGKRSFPDRQFKPARPDH